MNSKVDVIVVGAGPSGIASAVTVARGGKKVVVLDRGKSFGTKNMFGGAVYLESVKKLFPKSFEKAPFERYTKKHSWAFLTEDNSVSINYENSKNSPSATVFRPKFDSWLVEEAKKEGVYFAPSTVVREILKENGKVVGVKTDLEDYKAPITIIADGANSLLTEQIGLKEKSIPKDVILGVKETLKLENNIINERLNLEENNGAIMEFFGGLGLDIVALGYLYTFKNHICIGLGISLEDLCKNKLKPYDLLDKLKAHPSVESLIKDGEATEYSAHLIPEWGFNKMPKLYAPGVLAVGDACGFVNPVHFEGTNLAIYSGILAGESALFALEKGDYSSKTLKIYEGKFKKSFVYKDLKSYRNVMKVVEKRKKSIFSFYPEIADNFFENFTKADSLPKKLSYRKFLKKFLFSRSIKEMISDCYQFAKTLIEVVK